MVAASQLGSDALRIWQAGLDAVQPERLVREALQVERDELVLAGERLALAEVARIAVVGAGKAGAAMAAAVEAALGQRLLEQKHVSGWVNVLDWTVRPLRRIHLHGARAGRANVPSQAGVDGARQIERIVESLGPDELLLCLISGGGSALLPAPVPSITLEDKVRITELLLARGASIDELNCVRKHLSTLKGGQLAARFRGLRLVSLIISDVVGDPLDVIASGPTSPDPTTFADAIRVLEKYKLLEDPSTPSSVLRYLEEGSRGERPETLKQLPAKVRNVIIGSNSTALDASVREAQRLGYSVLNLGSCLEGETAAVACVLADVLRGVLVEGQPVQPPACLISGGETTVQLGGAPGKGGRNQEFVLAAAARLAARRLRNWLVLSGGTDGEDGPTDAAGAWADAELFARAAKLGLDPTEFLARHDSYHFFEQLDGLIKTGPTNTNVMDVRVMLAAAGSERR